MCVLCVCVRACERQTERVGGERRGGGGGFENIRNIQHLIEIEEYTLSERAKLDFVVHSQPLSDSRSIPFKLLAAHHEH